jgi:Uma2 family endonuclease
MIFVPHYISPDEYLALEHQSLNRHEYRQGLVYAMAGGTDNHDRIAFNSDLAPILIRVVVRRFDENIKTIISGNVGMSPDLAQQLSPEHRGQ